jgi:hypothetical protein
MQLVDLGPDQEIDTFDQIVMAVSNEENKDD